MRISSRDVTVGEILGQHRTSDHTEFVRTIAADIGFILYPDSRQILRGLKMEIKMTPEEEERLAYRWAKRIGLGMAALGIVSGPLIQLDPLIIMFLIMTGMMLTVSEQMARNDLYPY